MHDAVPTSVRGSSSAKRLDDMQRQRYGIKNGCRECPAASKLGQLRYGFGFLEVRRLLTILAAVKPRTMATTLIRISRAMVTAEGERSIECLTLNVEKEIACLTATSENSIGFWP